LRQTFVSSRRGGTLPDYRTKTEAALSEERRACFVGVCRAETHLTLTRIEQYRGLRKAEGFKMPVLGVEAHRSLVLTASADQSWRSLLIHARARVPDRAGLRHR